MPRGLTQRTRPATALAERGQPAAAEASATAPPPVTCNRRRRARPRPRPLEPNLPIRSPRPSLWTPAPAAGGPPGSTALGRALIIMPTATASKSGASGSSATVRLRPCQRRRAHQMSKVVPEPLCKRLDLN